jgi:hypothetical protein
MENVGMISLVKVRLAKTSDKNAVFLEKTIYAL